MFAKEISDSLRTPLQSTRTLTLKARHGGSLIRKVNVPLSYVCVCVYREPVGVLVCVCVQGTCGCVGVCVCVFGWVKAPMIGATAQCSSDSGCHQPVSTHRYQDV